MDTLTHALVGATVAAARWPGTHQPPATPRWTRATLIACVVAAELPDLDYLWPAGDPVLQTLQAHRGPSHALAAAPLWALGALGVGKLLARDVAAAPLYLRCLAAVVLGHLLPDLWTGWGTRLFLPISDRRLALDWTGVIDPFFTAPLLAGVLAGWRWRTHWRRAVGIGAAVATVYLASRIGLRHLLEREVRAAYPTARQITVFPALLGVTRWRYVAVTHEDHRVGEVALGAAPREQGRWPLASPVPAALGDQRPVAEALAWARFPVVTLDGGELRVADLRYHLGGEPTLAFVFTFGPTGSMASARLDRGGTARDLLGRLRGPHRQRIAPQSRAQ